MFTLFFEWYHQLLFITPLPFISLLALFFFFFIEKDFIAMLPKYVFEFR